MFDFEKRAPAMVALLERLVQIESPSSDKAAVNRVGAAVAAECERLGAAVELVANPATGDHVIARFRPSTGVRSGGEILLMHHMDTVFPIGTLERMPFREEGDRILGPGALDMKGGIVVSLFALAAAIESGGLARPVTFLSTSDEEIGSPSSRALIERLAGRSALAIVMESGLLDGSIKTARKGVGRYRVEARGRSAHAGGAHEEGRNAIAELAHQVIAIQAMTDYRRGTTLSVGTIRGGDAVNVVPDLAVAEVDFRVALPEEAARVEAAMRALAPVTPDTSIAVEGGLNRPPMPEDALMAATFAKAAAIAAGIGQALRRGSSGGGSDGNFVSPLGIPLLDGMGVYGEGLHSEREYILARSLPERAALLSAILSEW